MKHILWIILFFTCDFLSAQDNQWLIKNGKAKTGFDEQTQLNMYDLPLSSFIFNGNQFSIDSIKHPIQVINAVPRNDFFVIYHDGNYYNSRNVNKGIIYPIAPQNSISYAIKTPYGQTNPIDFFYLTNIYEEDDPPSSIKIGNNTSAPVVEIGTTINQNSLELNHDFVAGKDVTLVVPKSLVNCPGGVTKLSFDSSILTPNLIFGNNTRYSFNEIIGLNLKGNQITGITTPANNHFINFKVRDSLPLSLIGQPSEIKLFCNTTEVASLKDTIRSGHDPNYIKVLCFYKKKIRRKNKFVVVYRVVFMNEGNGVVDSVKVRLKFPSHINIDSADAYHFFYGGRIGYRKHIDSFVSRVDGDYLEFHFKEGFLKPVETKSKNNNLYTKGGIEFRVILDQNPQNLEVKLLPDLSEIRFDRVLQGFNFYYDPKVRASNGKFKKRRIFKNVCDCPTSVKPIECK